MQATGSWAVGIRYHQKIYAADAAMIFPVSGHGRPRQYHIADSYEDRSVGDAVQRTLTARFAALPFALPMVRPAHP